MTPGERLNDAARDWIGRSLPAAEIQISRHDVRRFAHATRARAAVHFDVEAAQAAGYRDLLAPPTFFMAIRVLGTALVPMDELRPDGNFFGPLPPLDVTHSLGGEMTIELLGDICAGDAITVQSQIVDLYEKSGRSGDLVFVVFERNYLNDRDELVVDERTTTVFR